MRINRSQLGNQTASVIQTRHRYTQAFIFAFFNTNKNLRNDIAVNVLNNIILPRKLMCQEVRIEQRVLVQSRANRCMTYYNDLL